MPARSARRKVAVTTSSDDEDPVPRRHMSNGTIYDEATKLSDRISSSANKDQEENDRVMKSTMRSNGKLKPVKGKAQAKPLASPSSTRATGSQTSADVSKAAIAKTKSGSKDVTKPSSKPIYSFFNAAAQRQASSQQSASPEKRPSAPSYGEPESIDSDDEGNQSLKLSNDSSIALTLRKRKVQHTTSFEQDTTLPLPSTQKFRKTGESSRVPSFSSAIAQDTTPWTDRFAPIDLTELAVHKRKVQDVSGWLQNVLRGRRQKVLVLKGAAGTAKTTTVHLLARNLGLEVVEWRNPTEADTGQGMLSASAQFDEFVNRAGRSGGLQFASLDDQTPRGTAVLSSKGESRENIKQQVLLIEEFPTSLSRTSTSLQAFRSTILQYVSSPAVPQHTSPIPIVMVISETLSSTNMAVVDSFTAHRLLGPELVNHPYIDTFEFNPIAPTFLTKALELVVVKEARKSGRRRTPGSEVLKRLAESGDVRSAVSSLEFMCLRGDDVGDMWSSKVALTKSKKKIQSAITKSEEEVLRFITNRESSLGIFHAVGRVCYNNRVDPGSSVEVTQPPDWMPQTLRRPKIPERDIDELINELGTDVSTFIAALHENYARSCYTATAETTLVSLFGSMDSLSDADLLSIDKFSSGTRSYSGSATESLRQDEMAFQAAVRGLLFHLPYPVHRSMGGETRKGDSHKMFYPASLRTWRKVEEIEDVVDVLMIDAQKGRLGSSIREPRRRAEGAADGDQAKGVDTWARNNAFSDQVSPGNWQDTSYIAVGKTELLLERLPYAAHILQSQDIDGPRAASVELISSVTRITGQAPEVDGNDDEEEPNEHFPGTPTKPGHHVDSIRPPSKASATGFPWRAEDNNDLSLPIAADISGLVLANDDIED